MARALTRRLCDARSRGFCRTEPSPDGTRAVGIRTVEARPEAIVLMVNSFEHLRRMVRSGS